MVDFEKMCHTLRLDQNFFYFITGRNEVVAKVIFLHVCVILFTGGVSGQGEPPLRQGEPPPGADPPGADTPLPPEQTTPREAHSSIRSTSGQYASYWNAFLFCGIFLQNIRLVLLPGGLTLFVREILGRFPISDNSVGCQNEGRFRAGHLSLNIWCHCHDYSVT